MALNGSFAYGQYRRTTGALISAAPDANPTAGPPAPPGEPQQTRPDLRRCEQHERCVEPRGAGQGNDIATASQQRRRRHHDRRLELNRKSPKVTVTFGGVVRDRRNDASAKRSAERCGREHLGRGRWLPHREPVQCDGIDGSDGEPRSPVAEITNQFGAVRSTPRATRLRRPSTARSTPPRSARTRSRSA